MRDEVLNLDEGEERILRTKGRACGGLPTGGGAETEGHGGGGRRPASGHGYLAGDGGGHGRRDGAETERTSASRHTQEARPAGVEVVWVQKG